MPGEIKEAPVSTQPDQVKEEAVKGEAAKAVNAQIEKIANIAPKN